MPYQHKKSESPHKKRYKKPISQKKYGEKRERNDTYSKNTKVGTFEMRKTSGIIKTESGDNVVIPSHMAGSASTGDLVKYSSHMSRFNTLQGRIISIIRRFKDQTYAEIVAKNEKSISIRLIESLYNISILLHSSPEVRTGLRRGDIVLVNNPKELLPRGVNYISLVSRGDNPLRFVDLLLDQHALSRTFDPLIIDSIVLPNIKSERANREDIRPLSVITIDGLDAKDLDDAISIESIENDGWRLGVHIADVSAYVTEGSPIDREAADRGTSIYISGGVIPMLPELLSNDHCSLNSETDKLTLSAWMNYDKNGNFQSIRISETIMRSIWRGDYDSVGRYVATNHPEEKDTPKRKDGSLPPAETHTLLGDFYTLTQLINTTHEKLGKLEFDTNELSVDMDTHGEMNFRKRDRHVAHRMIETAMIEANRHIAKWMYDQKLIVPSRVHQGPSPEKIEIYTKLEQGMLEESLQKELQKLPIDRARIQRFLTHIRTLPESDILERKILSTLSKAYYTANVKGHFGLALPHYIHFTSPIRRYPDLLAHRIIKEHLHSDKQKPNQHIKKIEKLLLISSERERRAIEIERAVFDIYRTQYFSSRIGQQYEARITSILPNVLFVEIDPGLEVSISGDYFTQQADNSIMMSGKLYRITDRIHIEITHINSLLSRVEARPIKKLST
ncbi:MAG: VacB/RNase II family 3'-5' exoribonuclease [Candidatus Gracilibacteria bacterium]